MLAEQCRACLSRWNVTERLLFELLGVVIRFIQVAFVLKGGSIEASESRGQLLLQ